METKNFTCGHDGRFILWEDHRKPIRCAVCEMKRLEKERDELQALFDLQHARTIVADAEYVAAHPKPDAPHGYLPDLGKLIDWLRSERDEARAAARWCHERVFRQQEADQRRPWLAEEKPPA